LIAWLFHAANASLPDTLGSPRWRVLHPRQTIVSADVDSSGEIIDWVSFTKSSRIRSQSKLRAAEESFIKAVWISLVSDIVPECNNVIPISTDQLGKWMAPTNEPEVKVRRGQRNDYKHRDVLPRSGKQGVHMLGAKLHLIATRLLLSMFSALLPRVAGMAFAVKVLRMPMCLEWKSADANKHNRTYGLLIRAPLCGSRMSPQPAWLA
jgi:hypothetical protein